MRTPRWWQDAIVYELYVDKFAGNFRGLTERLDYLTALGVNCLHLLPFYPSPMVDDGYDVSDYLGIRSELGTLDDFKHFTHAAHERGMHVLADLVLNHVSDQHPWFRDARSSVHSPYRTYFLWSDTGTEYPDAPNPFSHLKQRNWIPDPAGGYYFATFYPQQPDLNWNEPRVLNEMSAIVDHWVNLGVDAFRLDAATHLIKKEGTTCTNLPETHAALKRLRAAIDARHTQVALLAEVQDSQESTSKYFATGDECHMLYDFPGAARAMFELIHGSALPAADTVAPPPGCTWVSFLRNHDSLVLRFLPDEQRAYLIDRVDPDRRYAFRGERGVSMRLSNLLDGTPHTLRDAFRTLFALPGVPALYYGDEIGMRNDTTIGTPADTRAYVRGTFDWAEAQRQVEDPDSLFSYVASLTRTTR